MPEQGPSWDLLADLQLLLQFHFMQNALMAGTLVAIVAGAAGYFVVLRGQSFAAHMLSQVGFPGAAAGVLVHVSPVLGLIVFCVAAALGIGWMGRDLDAGHRAESAAVGSILAFSLGLGLLFFRLYAGSAQGIYGFLFGTILGISDRDIQLTLAVAVVSLVALGIIGRPLVFASVDPDVAEARGVAVRALAVAFLVVLAFAVAITVQIVGTLLIFALLVTPGAAALQLTARPGGGLALSIALSVAFTWVGLAMAYFSNYPVGFFITSLAFGTYLVIRAVKWLAGVWSGRKSVVMQLGIGTE
jgi:zinc/manganese transport system permease protein